MNFKELGIQTIKPLALLSGGLNGTRFIAEATTEEGNTKLISLIPPDYNPSNGVEIEEYILESAVEKHNYVPVEHDPILSTEEYEKYLREINQPPE